MSTTQAQTNSDGASEGLAGAESQLGRALIAIHRAANLLDQPDHAVGAQSALADAAKFIEAARQAHAKDMGVAAGAPAQTCVDSETVAVIAAAIAALLGRTYKLVSVQPVIIPTPNLSAWAMEGRSQLLTSHKVR